MNCCNEHKLPLSALKPDIYIVFRIKSKNGSSTHDIKKVGKILEIYNNHWSTNTITVDLFLNSTIDTNQYDIREPISDKHNQDCYLMKNIGLIYKINIDFNDIYALAKANNKKNNYDISEADIQIGDMVKLRLTDTNNEFIFPAALITDIIPDTTGCYSFVYELMNNKDASIQDSYRGLGNKLQTVGVKSIVNRHHPTKLLSAYTLLDIAKAYFGRGIIRKVKRVHTDSKNIFTYCKFLSEPEGRFNAGWWDINLIDKTTNRKDFGKQVYNNPTYVPYYSSYYGYSREQPSRKIGDLWEDKPIYFHSRGASIIDFNKHYTGNWQTSDRNNNVLPTPPIHKSMIYGIVEDGERGPYFKSWSVVTPEFLMFWTLIMYNNNNPTTKDLTQQEIKSKLTLVKERDIIENNNLTAEERTDKCIKLRPFFGSVDIDLDPLFYWHMYSLINNYSIDKFKEILEVAKKELNSIGTLTNPISQAAMVLYNIGWYVFLN